MFPKGVKLVANEEEASEVSTAIFPGGRLQGRQTECRGTPSEAHAGTALGNCPQSGGRALGEGEEGEIATATYNPAATLSRLTKGASEGATAMEIGVLYGRFAT